MTEMTEMNSLVQKICVVSGLPFAHGQSETGVTKGPQYLRKAGLSSLIEKCGWAVEDRGDLTFHEDKENDYTTSKEKNIKNITFISEGCLQIFEHTKALSQENKFVLNLGGDHGIAGATIAAMLVKYPDLAVIWIDAHADANTPATSPSGNYHGMPVAHLLGWFGHDGSLPGFDWDQTYGKLSEERLAMIGLRDVDDGERELLAKSKVHTFSMQVVDRRGIGKIVKEALNKVDPDHNRPLHLSFDIDSCDPSIAPGTGTCARGGLTYREAHFIAETLHSTGRLVSMDLVEINPDLDVIDELCHGDRLRDTQVKKTVRLGVDLIGSALGTSIL